MKGIDMIELIFVGGCLAIAAFCLMCLIALP